MVCIMGETLILRQFQSSDLDEFYEIVQDAWIKEYLPGVYSEDKSEIEANIAIYEQANFIDDIYLVIVDKETNKLVGAIIAVRTTKRDLEMSYFISTLNRGRGLIAKALILFFEWYKGENINKNLILKIKRGNRQSIRSLWKLEAKGVCFESCGEDKSSNEFIYKVDLNWI